jgi:hypothetical protein
MEKIINKKNVLQMPILRFEFDSDKGVAMLKYLLNKMGGVYNYMALLKLAFFSDRYHIRNFARPVSNDRYFALKFGPMPSGLGDLITVASFYDEDFTNIDKYTLSLKDNKIDMDEFSKSDILAMDFAIEHFGNLGKGNVFNLANLTHAYPEWDKYKTTFSNNSNSSRKKETMNYLDFLLNANPNHPEFKKLHFIDPFVPLTKEQIENIRQEMINRFGDVDC